jgi:hypothetical protein
MASAFLSRWTGKGDQEAGGPEVLPPSPADQHRLPPAETLHPGKRTNPSMVAWSASPSLEKLSRELEEQMKAIEEARRYLADRVFPFQRHLAAQRRNADQALKQLDARVRPLRQYLEGQEQNLGRVGQHLNAELREQFDAFGRFLQEQHRILEMATRYLDEQPRPLQRYCEDQQRVVELIYKEIEEKLEPFTRFLREQQRVLESIATPQILEEFETMAGYMQERERTFERYSLSPEHRPGELFAELDEIYSKYKSMQTGSFRLLMKVLEQTRLADDRLREALRPAPREMVEARPGEEPRPEG